MKIFNYNVDDKRSDYKQKVSFMPDRCFRTFVCGPSGSSKTNLLPDMIYRLLYFDKIYSYAKNLQQSKYQHLIDLFEPIREEAGYPIIEASNDKIIPLDKMLRDNQKLVIFDDYLNTGTKNDAEIRNYFTNSRNKNCSCICLSQSFYNTDETIRLNCAHHCIFEQPSSNEQNMICRELGISKSNNQRATQAPYEFIYVDKPKKRVAKNVNEKI